MSTKQEVLRLLYSTVDKPLSGQDIADHLNLSRTAVWKAIQQLKKDGYEITSSTKVGYQLSRQTDLLTLEGIRTHLGEQLQDWDIQVFETTTSTNDLAKNYGASRSKSSNLLYCRRANSWTWPSRKNLPLASQIWFIHEYLYFSRR